jgi:hypothetical protein
MSGSLSTRRMMALPCCIVVAAMFGAFAADGSPFEGTGFTQDPCSLLTNAEVSRELGHPVAAVRNRDQQVMCEWTPSGQPGLDTTVFLEYQKQNSRFHMDVIRNLKRPNTGPGVQRFDIGNGALLSTARREITVLVGDSTFRIGAGGSIPMSDEALVNLARLALPRAH